MSATVMQFGSSSNPVDETPLLVLRGERSRSRPLPRQLKIYGITSAIVSVLGVVVVLVLGIVTSNWWYPGAMGVAVLVLVAYTFMRQRGSRIEVTATELRLVDGFGRAKSVPIAEVSSLVRGTIEVGPQRRTVFAVLVIDKAGRPRLRFGHFVDAERLTAMIGVPVAGRFEDRVPYRFDAVRLGWVAVRVRERPGGRPALDLAVNPVFSDVLAEALLALL